MPLPIHWQTASNIRFADISKRLETATLEERHELLIFIRLHNNRIRPRISDRWLNAEMLRYFLECIARVRDGDANGDYEDFHSPFEAAGQMVRWFNWYRSNEKENEEIQKVADKIADFYRQSNDFCRNCIETGFLEHVLETLGNRSFFLGWADDPVLADGYNKSLKWGLSHETTDKP